MSVPDQPMEESLYPIRWSLRETKNNGSTGSARERHGLFRCGAFQAARIRRPSIQYSRVVLPQARIAGHSTSQVIVRFQPAPRLSVGDTALGYECGAFATYRPVSCASSSTICRCITASARRYSIRRARARPTHQRESGHGALRAWRLGDRADLASCHIGAIACCAVGQRAYCCASIRTWATAEGLPAEER
jgi:hypothetical protein